MKKGQATYNKTLDNESSMRALANIFIDRVLEMTPEERKELDKKIRKSKIS